MAHSQHLLNTTFVPTSTTLRYQSAAVDPPPISTARRTQIEAKIREIFVPALSSTMTEGKIVSWVKSEGYKLSKGESVVFVESDKANMDVETFHDGYFATILVEEGSVTPVGSVIGLLSESQDEISQVKSKVASAT